MRLRSWVFGWASVEVSETSEVVCPLVVNQKSSSTHVPEVSVNVFRSSSNAGSYTSKPENSASITSPESISAISPEFCLPGQKGSPQVDTWDQWNADQSLVLRKPI